MTKEVIVSISGIQFELEDNDAIELITIGDYYNRNGKHYILYDECIEGDATTTKNTLKLGKNTLEMTKKGSSNVHMVFEEGKTNMTYYDTPLGSLFIGIHTESITRKESDDKLEITVKYSLEVNYTHVSDCEIKMVIKSKHS